MASKVQRAHSGQSHRVLRRWTATLSKLTPDFSVLSDLLTRERARQEMEGRRSTGFSHGSFQGDSGDSIPSTAAFQSVARPPRAASPVPPPVPQRAIVCTRVCTHTHAHRDTHTQTHKHTHTDTQHTRAHALRANRGAVRGGDIRSQCFSFTLPAKKFHRPTGTHFPRKSNHYKRFPMLWWEVKVEHVCFKPTLYHGCTFQVSREGLTNSKMAFP